MGWDLPSDTTKRGSLPSVVEYCILAYVAGKLSWVCNGIYGNDSKLKINIRTASGPTIS